MKKILITGGAGFIGSHTAVSLIESGYAPVLVDNFSNSDQSVLKGIEKVVGRKLIFCQGDCNDASFLKNVFKRHAPIAGVIHFAAYKSVNESIEQPAKYYQNNIGSLLTLLDVMSDRGIPHLVFSSSATVYGFPERNPITEDFPLKEVPSVYGKTKQICEQVINDVVRAGKPLKAIMLRYFNPIGAHPSGLIGELPIGIPNNLVPYITQTAAGIREKFTLFGSDYQTPDGSCIRDFIHVLDLADTHVKAFGYLDTVQDKSCCEVFNVGTGRGHSVKEVVQTFEQANGLKLNYVVGPRRPGDVEACYANVDRAKRILKWEAKRSLSEALQDAWRWQKNLQKK